MNYIGGVSVMLKIGDCVSNLKLRIRTATWSTWFISGGRLIFGANKWFESTASIIIKWSLFTRWCPIGNKMVRITFGDFGIDHRGNFWINTLMGHLLHFVIVKITCTFSIVKCIVRHRCGQRIIFMWLIFYEAFGPSFIIIINTSSLFYFFYFFSIVIDVKNWVYKLNEFCKWICCDFVNYFQMCNLSVCIFFVFDYVKFFSGFQFDKIYEREVLE